MRRVVPLVLAAAAALSLSSAARADLVLRPCPGAQAVECGTLTVPLDRSGGVPGTVALHVERRTAPDARGVVFLLAGGPGQPSAQDWDLASAGSDPTLRALAGYTLVAVDPRGTGASDALDCGRGPSPACIDRLGPRGRFYTSRDNAADLEDVRLALGAPQAIVLGVSYGTKLAQAYARLYPQSVARLVLDSVAPVGWPDLFRLAPLRAIPGALDNVCAAAGCARRVGESFAAAANRVARNGLDGSAFDARGERRPVDVTGGSLLALAYLTDLDEGVAAAIPGALAALRHGNSDPLARLVGFFDGGAGFPGDADDELNAVVNVLTTCGDAATLPWPAGAIGFRTRARAVEAAIAALPAGSTGPFGRWAAEASFLGQCLLYDGRPDGSSPATLPAPDVPVLAISGTFDIRTPPADARRVVAEYPHGRLLLVPGAGHSVLNASACARDALTAWLADAAVPAACPLQPPALRPVPAPPTRAPLRPAAVVRAVAGTVSDAEALLDMGRLLAGSSPRSFGGLRGGSLTIGPGARSIALHGDRFAPGVAVDGVIRVSGEVHLHTQRFSGSVRGCAPGVTFRGLVARDGTVDVTVRPGGGCAGRR